MKIYEWNEGDRRGVPAQVVGEIVARIEVRDGCCKPQALVEEARQEDSPLHPLFEWDDPTAAEYWRTHQARNIIRTLRVIDASDEQPHIAFVSVTDNGDRGYVSRARILSDAELQQKAEADVMRYLAGFRKRHADITKFAQIWIAIDETAKSIGLEV